MKHAIYLELTGANSSFRQPRNHGEIIAFNSSLNYAGSMASDVQTYLAGLVPTDEEDLLDRLFPPIETNDFFQFAKADDDFYLTEADDSDVRAIGASFKRVEHRGSIVTDSTQQKGLTMRVDHKTLRKVNGKIVPGWETDYAADLKSRLVRADIVRGLLVIDAGAVNANLVWDAASNPDGDLRNQAEASRVASGLRPTHLVMGNSAQLIRKDAYEAAGRSNHVMAAHADYTLEQIAAAAGAKQAILEDGLKQVKRGAARIDRLGNVTYTYSATPSPVINDPSNIKRAWNQTPFNGKWAVSIKTHDLFTDITVWQESKIFVPMTTGIYKRTISRN